MQSSSTFTAGSAVFDEQNPVSSAGLVPVLELAEQTGRSRLIGEHVDLPSTRSRSGAVNSAGKLTSIFAPRMGVAQTARRRHPAHAIPGDVKGYFAEMGRIAVNIGYNAKDVVLSGNPDKAVQLAADDDAIDELHRQLSTIVLDHQWPHPVATAVDVTLLSRYYERFADHAVTVGRRVIFQATGTVIT